MCTLFTLSCRQLNFYDILLPKTLTVCTEQKKWQHISQRVSTNVVNNSESIFLQHVSENWPIRKHTWIGCSLTKSPHACMEWANARVEDCTQVLGEKFLFVGRSIDYDNFWLSVENYNWTKQRRTRRLIFGGNVWVNMGLSRTHAKWKRFNSLGWKDVCIFE